MVKLPQTPQRIGVIISTFNHPEWLKKVLWGYACQTRPADEIIVADDGSSEDTRLMLVWAKEEFQLPIKHVWHADGGFQKNTIVNAAVTESESDYLIFTDQDCIPRRDFVETHLKLARKGHFLSGGYFKLPMSLSLNLKREDVESQVAFSLAWILRQGVTWHFKCTKLIRASWFNRLMNRFTTAKATWNGCNSSGWKKDILRINGFNEALRYGGEDRELGERLTNLSITGLQIRYSAICLHLDHERPYKEEETIRANKIYRKGIRKTHLTRTLEGIYKTPEKFLTLPKKVLFLNFSDEMESYISKWVILLEQAGDDVQQLLPSFGYLNTLQKSAPDVVLVCRSNLSKKQTQVLKRIQYSGFKTFYLEGSEVRNEKQACIARLDLEDFASNTEVLKRLIHS